MLPSKRLVLVSLIIFAWGLECHSLGQFRDWKGSTISVDLERRRPPDVYLEGTRICVSVDSVARPGQSLAPALSSMLESELFSQDRRLSPDCTAPRTTVSATIADLETMSAWGEWREVPVLFSKEKKRVRDLSVSGRLTVTYQALDTASERVVDSDVLNTSFAKKYPNGEGAPTLSAVQQAMAKDIVNRIAMRLAETNETVEVWLARGKLKNISQKLGKNKAWARMLEELEIMDPLEKPEDEAYRQYNIAVAYEALAYQAEDLEQSKEFLEKAAIGYGKAIDMNSEEKYFLGPQKRIEAAIVHYDRIAQVQEEEGPSAPALGSRGVSVGDSPEVKPLTNQDIVDLHRVGSDDAGLVDLIRDAERVDFDLSAQGRLQLLKNGVSNHVIAAMRDRQNKEGG